MNPNFSAYIDVLTNVYTHRIATTTQDLECFIAP